MAEEFLVARDVSYRYAARRGVEAVSVLQRFSVSLTQGEFFCLLGPSGCGKTTVLSLMAGFLEPVGGVLTLAGRPIRGPGIDRTVVFQGDDALFNWLRTIDNVAFGLRMQGMAKERRHAVAREYLHLVHLDGQARQTVGVDILHAEFDIALVRGDLLNPVGDDGRQHEAVIAEAEQTSHRPVLREALAVLGPARHEEGRQTAFDLDLARLRAANFADQAVNAL